MKDMSEEKDGLFEKGQLLVQLTEKIKDLESRLKEAEKESYECTCTTNPYESLCRFCYVQNALKICKDNIELKQRLSQAEAELKKYKTDPNSYVEAIKCLCGSVSDFIKYHHNPIVKQKNEEILSLEQKLSTLLKDAEGMAGIIAEYDDEQDSLEDVLNLRSRARQALADFRALKETK